jgi:hypothetical protein
MDSFQAASELITVADLLAYNFGYAHFDRGGSTGFS